MQGSIHTDSIINKQSLYTDFLTSASYYGTHSGVKVC